MSEKLSVITKQKLIKAWKIVKATTKNLLFSREHLFSIAPEDCLVLEDAPLGVQVSSGIIKKGKGRGHPYLEDTQSERKDLKPIF